MTNTINMWGAPISTQAVLRCLVSTFRLRCHTVQGRLLLHYQMVQPHQILQDDSVAQDEVIIEDMDGIELGRVIGLYCPD